MVDPKLSQYDYKANSNLVLPADSSLIDKRPSNEATGEVQSLVGKISGKMGDRANKPKALQAGDVEEKRRMMKRRKITKNTSSTSKLKQDLKKRKGQSAVDIDTKDLLYTPKTKSSKEVYPMILKFVSERLDFTAREHTKFATHEVLKTMKDKEMREDEKRATVVDLLFTNPQEQGFTDEDFNVLSNYCKKIDDFIENKVELDVGEEDLDEIEGDNILDEFEDGDSDSYTSEVRGDLDDDSEADDEDHDDLDDAPTIHIKDTQTIDDVDDPFRKSKNEPFKLNPRDIDAHWLQRNLRSRRIFEGSDAESLQKKEEIFAVLEGARDDKELEIKLIKLIGKNHFDFIKLLKQNRKMIIYCTKLARSSGKEQNEIKTAMRKDKELISILSFLEEGVSMRTNIKNERSNFAPMDILEDTDESKCQILNLEDLANNQVKVIPTMRVNEPIKKPGYQEYHIEPRKRPEQDFYLKSISELPEEARPAFKGFKTLNLIQSKIYDKAMFSADNLLICAPTGAGKTNVALLCMLKEIREYLFNKEDFKIIYIAPIKALAQEMVENFRSKLSGKPYYLNVDELTGDHQLDQRQIADCHIIVCTPEKWDIVTRKGTDRQYTKVVKLVIFDEIHLLHNERGAVLEALIARIKRHKEVEGEPIRIVGLSATLPNYQDVCRFIESPESGTFFFDSRYRPIPIRQQYISLTEKHRLKSIRLMNDIVYEKVMERVSRQQILIFVHFRDDTMNTALFLKDNAFKEDKSSIFIPSGPTLMEKIDEWDKEQPFEQRWKLKELLQFGIGIHHAGMSKTDRARVEELFRERHIRVLVSTATLAWGVNLPAHTVIIKGTQVYRPDKGRFMDLDSLDVTQMLGRAGRPQYDKEGEGIVITDQSTVFFYMSLMNEQLPVESQLIARLPDFLNAECVIGNVESTQDAREWLSKTFLTSRMISVLSQRNKDYMSLYGIESEAEFTDPDLKKHLLNLVYSAACILDDRGLIIFDRRSGFIQSTELGRIASHYNCSSNTIKTFHDSLQPTSGDLELFRIFSLADEFQHVHLRKDEAIDLQALMNEVPYPIDDKYANPGANKVNALLQVYIYRRNIEGSAIVSDMHFIKDNAARLARAMNEIVLFKRYAKLAELSLSLCKKIDKRMSLCHSPIRQFSEELDDHIIQRLENKNFTIDHLRALDAAALSELLRESHSRGKKVYNLLKHLPKLEVDAKIRPITHTSLQIELKIKPNFIWNDHYHSYSEAFWIFVNDVNGENLLHHELIHIRKFKEGDIYKKHTSFFIPFINPMHPFYFIRILSDKWFGCDQTFELALGKIKLPKEICIITHPIDMELQTTSSLVEPFKRIFEDRFKEFNEIQTHAFEHLYRSDDDILLLASAGSGKKVCAELTILRNLAMFADSSKIAVICGNKQSAEHLYDLWSATFKKPDFDFDTVLLRGNHRIDAPKVDKQFSGLVIGDPESWNILLLPKSKKKKDKLRNLIYKFQLFIINDIHLLHDDENSYIEWLCSKIRINSLERNQLKDEVSPCRIVAFGSPVVCADNVKSWILQKEKDKESIVLNFPPAIRPVKLKLIVQKFYQSSYTARLISMQRPVYRNIINYSPDKHVIVFVSDFYQAQNIAERLYVYAKNDKKRFTNDPPSIGELQELEMRDLLAKGIGYLYLGMDENDKKMIENWFYKGQIKVLVVTVSLCWALSARSYLTIIMDTQQYDGEASKDYELGNMMQMVGLTGRPLEDHESKCIVMCQTSKGELYERLLSEPISIESKLPQNLIKHVNFEVAANSIKQLDRIYNPYLACSFLHKRISKNPNFYGVAEKTPDTLMQYFDKLVNDVARHLHKNEFILINNDDPDEPKLESESLADISLEYHLRYGTLLNFNESLKDIKFASLSDEQRKAVLIELLSSGSDEFENLPIRFGERDILKSFARKFKVKGSLHSSSFKTRLLILSQYSREKENLSGELLYDIRYILGLSYRMLMSIVDLAWLNDSFHLAEAAIILSQKLTQDENFGQKAPHLNINGRITKEEDRLEINVDIERDNDPVPRNAVATKQCNAHLEFREEGWCFLITGSLHGKNEKFVLFKRERAPVRGRTKYKLEFTDDSNLKQYNVQFMSDYYYKAEKSIILEAPRSR